MMNTVHQERLDLATSLSSLLFIFSMWLESQKSCHRDQVWDEGDASKARRAHNFRGHSQSGIKSVQLHVLAGE